MMCRVDPSFCILSLLSCMWLCRSKKHWYSGIRRDEDLDCSYFHFLVSPLLLESGYKEWVHDLSSRSFILCTLSSLVHVALSQ